MNIDTWLAFVTAYTIISLLPGPSVFMSIAQSISKGLYPAFLCILGDVFGGLVVMTLSYVGVGAVLLASPQFFFLIKWFGVIYMAYLGLSAFFNASRMTFELSQNRNEERDNRESIKAGFFVGLFNPKAIIFYVAFLSQFIDPNIDPVLQYVVLSITASAIVILVLFAYALIANQASTFFKGLPARRRLEYSSGVLFLVGSVWMAITR